MEQLDYNLLFRWFTGLGIDDPVWDVAVADGASAEGVDQLIAQSAAVRGACQPAPRR